MYIQMLHSYNDGSILKILKAKELILLPIWKGNRILDKEHASIIKKSIGSNIQRLDSGYNIISYEEKNSDDKSITTSYLIDGQHRASVIRDFYRDNLCEPDFDVTITERRVDSESDAIEYFNMINNVKRQYWNTDPNLLINKYITEIETAFNTNKKLLLIRPGSTCRPYLSSDKIREKLKKYTSYLKQNKEDIKIFIEKIIKKNMNLIKQFQIESTLPEIKDSKIKERAIVINFTLGCDPELQWIKECLI